MMLNYRVENEICHEFTFPSVQGIFPEILQQSVFRTKKMKTLITKLILHR